MWSFDRCALQHALIQMCWLIYGARIRRQLQFKSQQMQIWSTGKNLSIPSSDKVLNKERGELSYENHPWAWGLMISPINWNPDEKLVGFLPSAENWWCFSRSGGRKPHEIFLLSLCSDIQDTEVSSGITVDESGPPPGIKLKKHKFAGNYAVSADSFTAELVSFLS